MKVTMWPAARKLRTRFTKECDLPTPCGPHAQIDPSFGAQSAECLSLLLQWLVGTGYHLPLSV